jgi:hypothetical protein
VVSSLSVVDFVAVNTKGYAPRLSTIGAGQSQSLAHTIFSLFPFSSRLAGATAAMHMTGSAPFSRLPLLPPPSSPASPFSRSLAFPFMFVCFQLSFLLTLFYSDLAVRLATSTAITAITAMIAIIAIIAVPRMIVRRTFVLFCMKTSYFP